MLLRSLAGRHRDRFPYVFVDCPPSLGLLTVNALAAANRLIVPVQCEYYALEGLAQLLAERRAGAHPHQPGLGVTGVLLTMYDARTRLASDVASEVRSHFGPLVFETVVPRSMPPRRGAEPRPAHHRVRLGLAPAPTPITAPPSRSSSVADRTEARGLGRGLAALVGRVPWRWRHGLGRGRARAHPAQRPASRAGRSTTSALDEAWPMSIGSVGLVQPIVVRDAATASRSSPASGGGVRRGRRASATIPGDRAPCRRARGAHPRRLPRTSPARI